MNFYFNTVEKIIMIQKNLLGKNDLVSQEKPVFQTIKQMGNARFLITRSSTFENYCLACKIMRVGRDMSFEEKKFIRMHVDCHGTKRWYLGDKYHRFNGPAVEYTCGTKKWYVDGKLHRVDGPAVEETTSFNAWWVEGKRHRVDGPAIEFWNGEEVWYFEGRLHREDGPAIKRVNGDKVWYVEGKKHRVNGPAVEWSDGSKEWWDKGKRMR